MKRLLMIVLSFALASVCASAQYRNDVAVDSLDGIMVKKGGTLVLDGVEVLRNNAPEVVSSRVSPVFVEGKAQFPWLISSSMGKIMSDGGRRIPDIRLVWD